MRKPARQCRLCRTFVSPVGHGTPACNGEMLKPLALLSDMIFCVSQAIPVFLFLPPGESGGDNGGCRLYCSGGAVRYLDGAS